MKVNDKILAEIAKYNKINQYIFEQEATDLGADQPPLPLPGGDPGTEPAAEPGADSALPPPPLPPSTGDTPEVVDVTTDTEVEEIGGEGEGETEEVDITDLIDTQKTMSDKQEEYFNNLFSQLETLQSKLGEMDQLVQKLNDIETKVDNYKPKTPEEKLELRSLDSGPFKQKLSDFFEDKMPEMEKSGKNEYVLTSDEIQNYNSSDIENSFDEGLPKFNSDIYYK